MSQTGKKLDLNTADQIGGAIANLLAPACEEFLVAGSVRRRKPEVSDIEILVRPKLIRKPGLLIDDGTEVSALDHRLAEVYEPGVFELHAQKPANGPRLKRLLWGGVVQVDLFICIPPASWGCLVAIRTGPGDFSKVLVTRRAHGGAMPDECAQHDGALWYGDIPCETPTEAAYFDLLGLPCWPPRDRTEKKLRDYIRLQNHSRKESNPC